MAQRQDFWIGLVTGAAIGATLAGWLRSAAGERFLSKASTWMTELFSGSQTPVARLSLRRDASENSGDPARLISERGRGRPRFTRTGGAPGGRDSAEVLEIPGRPGQLQNDSISEPIRPSSRTIDFNKG